MNRKDKITSLQKNQQTTGPNQPTRSQGCQLRMVNAGVAVPIRMCSIAVQHATSVLMGSMVPYNNVILIGTVNKMEFKESAIVSHHRVVSSPVTTPAQTTSNSNISVLKYQNNSYAHKNKKIKIIFDTIRRMTSCTIGPICAP